MTNQTKRAIRGRWRRIKIRSYINKLSYCNPPRAICNHLIGSNHSSVHRMLVGFIIMMLGVMFAKTAGGPLGAMLPHTVEYLGHWFADLTGYLSHAIGAMPYLESLAKWGDIKDKQE